MGHDNRPPEHSFLDGMGRRHIRIDVTDCSGLPESLFEKYPTLSHRNDIRICINDAKVVKHINQRITK